MSPSEENFTGRWLHDGPMKGTEFAHTEQDFQHDQPEAGGDAVRMRHTFLSTEAGSVAVWIPSHWNEQQAREALESSW